MSLNEMRRKGPRGCTGPMDVLYLFWGATTLNPGQTPALCSIEAKTVVLFSDKTR
ncbi:MAG: hypothetical protein ABW206_02810 [Agrobacterium vaccinii]